MIWPIAQASLAGSSGRGRLLFSLFFLVFFLAERPPASISRFCHLPSEPGPESAPCAVGGAIQRIVGFIQAPKAGGPVACLVFQPATERERRKKDGGETNSSDRLGLRRCRFSHHRDRRHEEPSRTKWSKQI